MRMSFVPLLATMVLAKLFLPSSAYSAPTCAEVMDAFRVKAPESQSTTIATPNNPFGCSARELQMFQVNANVIASSAPVADPSDLYGTWLGDDVVTYLLGLTVAGQQVLRISPGSKAGSIGVEQFWFKPELNRSGVQFWDENLHYTGVISQGQLFAQDEPGKYGDDPYDPNFRYPFGPIERERSYDLHVKQSLNYFERPVSFAISGDTLVLKIQGRHPVNRSEKTRYATFTRVAPGAPEFAQLLVLILELSQARYFDCFTHQLSEKKGRLIDAIAPFGVDEIEVFTRQYAMTSLQFATLGSQPQNASVTKQERQQSLLAKLAELTALRQRPHYAAFTRIADTPRLELGCPALH